MRCWKMEPPLTFNKLEICQTKLISFFIFATIQLVNHKNHNHGRYNNFKKHFNRVQNPKIQAQNA